MNKSRLNWVDSAKGILIVLVAMVHIIGRGEELGIDCQAIGVIGVIDGILCFRMPAFFILAGFWGRYDMGFKEFLLKNARGMLLPLLVFSYIGGGLHEVCYELLKGSYNPHALEWPFLNISLDFWFVLALFIAKCVYWMVCHISPKQIVRLIICIGIYFWGVFSLEIWFLPNFVCWKWAMVMLVYLPLGQIIKQTLGNRKILAISLVVFVGGWFWYQRIGSIIPIPGGGMRHMNMVRALPSLLLCTAGSFAFLYFCSFIRRASVLELLGRNTLAIYVMHGWIELLSMKVLRSVFAQGVWMSTVATLVTLFMAVFLPCIISEILNRPKFRWILGKS